MKPDESMTSSWVKRPGYVVLILVAVCCIGFLAAGTTGFAAVPAGTPGASATPSVATPHPQGRVNDDVDPNSEPQVIRGSTTGIVSNRVPLSQKHVYDPFRLINSSDEQSLEGDARKVSSAGIPVLVYIRQSSSTKDQSQTYADNLRTTWNVESANGADDGLVILVSMNPEAPRSGTIVFSWGTHTFPVNGMNADRLNEIYEQIMLPQMRSGQLYDALYLSLRQMTYEQIFVPGDPPATSPRQDDVSRILAWLAPIVTIVLTLLVIAFWFLPQRRMARLRRWRRVVRGVGWVVLIALLPISVYGRSASAVGWSVILLVALLCDWLSDPTRREARSRKPRPHKIVSVAPNVRVPRRSEPGRTQQPRVIPRRLEKWRP